MMIELEPLFKKRTVRENDKSARGHEMTQYFYLVTYTVRPTVDASEMIMPAPLCSTQLAC